MYRKCILVCLLLLIFNGLFHLQGSNSISASDPADFFGDIYRNKIRFAIKTASKVLGSWKPLSFFTPLDETCVINRTKSSLDVRILTPDTISTMTGGIFGRDVYEFYKFSLYWQDTLCNETSYNLVSQVSYFNMEYGTYEKALGYRDGIVVINFPVATNGDYDNPKFNGLMKSLQKNIKATGDSAIINSGLTYTWYVDFPYGSIYHLTRRTLFDEKFGRKYSAIVIQLPLDQRKNYISNEQYSKTFGKMKVAPPESSTADLFRSDLLNSMERHKGIIVCELPA